MESNKVKYYTKSETDSEKTIDVAYKGLLFATIIVPKDKKLPITLNPLNGIDPYYARRIATLIYLEYKRDVNVHMKRSCFKIDASCVQQKKPMHKNPDLEWRKYYDLVNKYMGKYCEYKCDKKIGINLVLKKNVKTEDAISAINTFLKKYPFVKLTVSQHINNPIDFDDTMSGQEIKAIVVSVLTWADVKNNAVKKYSDSKQQTVLQPRNEKQTTETDDDCETVSMANRDPRRDLDPMILEKPLTLICNPNQDVETAKKLAQKKANEQYTWIKLLDNNSRFICNIYPTITAKEHAFRRGGRIRQAIYQKLSEREIGE